MTGNLQGILGLVITSSVLIAIPGPSILFLVGQALSAGKKREMPSVCTALRYCFLSELVRC